MNLHLHFILVNSEFNKGLADDLYNGEESEDNIKFLWEDEFQVSEPVKAYKIRNNAIYTLAGSIGKKAFSYEIWDTTILECTTEKGEMMQFAVSKKLLKKTEKVVDEQKNETHMYFYLRDTVGLENPMNGVYISKDDFPKELKPKKTLRTDENG
jgi:hypothetical protein